MKRHCSVCKEEREFNHISEDALENVYECDTCAFKFKRKTRTGWFTAVAPGVFGGGLIATVLELLESHNDHDS